MPEPNDPRLDALLDKLLAEQEKLRIATVWQAHSLCGADVLEGPKARVAAARAAIHEHYRTKGDFDA